MSRPGFGASLPRQAGEGGASFLAGVRARSHGLRARAGSSRPVAPRAGRATRLLSLPGRSSSMCYVRDFCDAMERDGAEIVDIRDARSRSFRFDVFHTHFPAHYVNESASTAMALAWAAVFAGCFALMRLLGKHIVHTVHDAVPFVPRRPWLLWRYLRIVHGLTSGYVFLSTSSQAAFYEHFPAERSKPFLMLGHASWPATLRSPEEKKAARRSLAGGGSDALLVGYLGFLRPRKGLETAALLPRRLRDGREVRAVVAGETQPCYRDEADAILGRLDPEALVRVDRPVSDEELAELIQAVDVVMLPYTAGSNSGMAMLALSNHGRVLGSGLPIFTELEEQVGAPWFYTFRAEGADSAGSLAAALERIGAGRPGAEDEERLARFNAHNSFGNGARRVGAFYEGLNRRRAGAA